MANSLRVHQLAKELNLSNEEMLQILLDEGIDVKSHLSALEEEMAELVRQHVQELQAKAAALKAASPLPPELDQMLEEEALNVRREKIGPKAARRKRPEDKEEITPAAKPVVVAKAVQPKRAAGEKKEVHLRPPIVVRDLAEALEVKPNALIQELMGMGIFAAISQTVDLKIAEQLCAKHDATLVPEKRGRSGAGSGEKLERIDPENLEYENEAIVPRPPVVAFLGHVDHGKTSLQDYIRKTRVAAGEAGGITQHVGASVVDWKGHKITFLDTPGHEAFTAMRARGAKVTDIVVLVVAADDGFMPQTVEALSHARAAETTIIVAANKIDLPGANFDRVLLQMQQNSLTPEEWGGDVGVVKTSAVTGAGIDNLLERIVLEAELLDLKANPDLPGKAIVIESQREEGLGSTANVLVKNGSLAVGDIILCGPHFGKIKALIDASGRRVPKATPSMPVKVVGLDGLPDCGLTLAVCDDERGARAIAEERAVQNRSQNLRTVRSVSIEDLFSELDKQSKKQLKVIVKTDVAGTCEAIAEALRKLESEKISIEILHSGVGAITENDVLLASASNALIVGFHVRTNPGVHDVARTEGVQILLFSIIYELIDKIRQSMEGMLSPTLKETTLGKARILQIFDVARAGKICGCQVDTGTMRVGAKVRVFRAGDQIYSGQIASLKRFKDDVREVRTGFECGIRLDNFSDFEVGDVIDAYDYEEVPTTL